LGQKMKNPISFFFWQMTCVTTYWGVWAIGIFAPRTLIVWGRRGAFLSRLTSPLRFVGEKLTPVLF
jgi:hypothetical protein